MAKPWQNADGLQVKFGNYWSDPTNFVNRPNALSTMGAVKQLEIDYDLSRLTAGVTSYTADLDNNGVPDGFSDADPSIPANASVLRVIVIAGTAAAGGTSFTVGTYQQVGTAIAATGLVTATEGVLANVDTAGKRVYGAGSLVSTTAGTAGVGTKNAFVGITPTGTFTAGTGRIIIEYIEPNAAAFSNT